MAKKELKLHAVVSPTETVVVSAYGENGKAAACTPAFYMVSSHIPPCVTIAINAAQRRKTLAAMLQSKAFVTVYLVVCIVLLAGCVKDNYGSFAEVYERGTVTQQLEYAVRNELLEDIGFNSVEYNGGSVGWEISDFEKEVSVVYHINHEKELVGTIKREIDDNELKIDVHDERYDIWLIGNTFSYMCPLSAEDLSLVDDKEYAKDYAMIFKMNSISMEDIKILLNVYFELSQKYMKTLYNSKYLDR